VPALITKLAAKWICFPAFGAVDFQLSATFAAKFGTIWIFKLAFRAFHF